MKPSPSRSISAFSKQTERLTHEYSLSGIETSTLFTKFGRPKNDPELYDVYAIRKEDVDFFTPWWPASATFDFEQFGYFLEVTQE